MPLAIKRSALARAVSLRIDPTTGGALLVLPPHVSEAKGLAFARSKADWLLTRLAALPRAVSFQPGESLPLRGVPHLLAAAPQARRGVWAEGGTIWVSGQPEYFARRLGDWLKREAQTDLAAHVTPMAERLDRPVTRITVRDTKSRWGSCTSRGHLAFSWRLIFAPADVLAYVAAHEVAHLVEMNHSPAFWRIVGQLSPQWKKHRQWLKQHGAELHRYG